MSGDNDVLISTRYPIDPDTVAKGDEISVETLTQLSGAERGSQKYQLFAMSLGDWIERQKAERGDHVVVTMRKGALRVLLDHEVPAYTARRWRESLGIQRRAIQAVGHVDRSQLPDDATRNQLDRQATSMAAQYTAARNAARAANRILNPAVRRSTPTTLGIPKGPKGSD